MARSAWEKNVVCSLNFFPGAASDEEREFFSRRFVDNYYAPWQRAEQETLKSAQFKDLIAKAGVPYEGISCSG